MSKVFEKALRIWKDLDLSYQQLAKADESRREFLIRISDYSRGNYLPLLVSKIEEEISENDSILQEGRSLITVINLVSSNMDLILSKEIRSFKEVISNLYGDTTKRVRDLGVEDFSFGYRIPRVMDTLDILTMYGAVGTVSFSDVNGLTLIDPLPIEMQKCIGFAGLYTVLEFNRYYKGKESVPYLNSVNSVAKKILSEDDSANLVFIPKGGYRKTVNGYNFYVNQSSFRAFPESEVEGCIVCNYNDVKVVLVPHEYRHAN